MLRSICAGFVAASILVAAATPAAASPADQVRVRVTGLKALGDALKTVNDALRGGGDLPPAVAQDAASRILRAAHDQYGWFPAGSGPQPGLKTAAKPDIWLKAQDFRAAQDAFARQADVFSRAAQSGNPVGLRLEARKLGGTCKGCHDTFRNSDD